MEDLESFNQQLADLFGIDTNSSQPMWRLVFSADQYEDRMTKYTNAGIELLQPEKRSLPKYKQWLPNHWVLENLIVIPFHNRWELCGIKTGYELVYAFMDDKGDPLPARMDVAQLVINSIMTAKGHPTPFAKYKEDPQAAVKEFDEMFDYLHGNETDVTTSLAYGEGVVVPSNYSKD